MTAPVLEIFLDSKALTLQHVQEVRVAAKIELVGAVDAHTPVNEQAGEYPVQDGCAHLGLDIVSQDGQSRILETFSPVLGGGNEYRDAVDKGTARFKDLLDIPFGRHFRTHRQVGDHHVRFRFFEQV